MNEVVVDKIAAYINELAAQLGVASEYVYAMMVRQMVIEGVVYSIILSLGLIVLSWMTHKAYRYYIYIEKEMFEDGEGIGILAMILGALSGLLLIINLIETPANVMKIFNPEYYAIKDIIEMISGK